MNHIQIPVSQQLWDFLIFNTKNGVGDAPSHVLDGAFDGFEITYHLGGYCSCRLIVGESWSYYGFPVPHDMRNLDAEFVAAWHKYAHDVQLGGFPVQLKFSLT